MYKRALKKQVNKQNKQTTEITCKYGKQVGSFFKLWTLFIFSQLREYTV